MKKELDIVKIVTSIRNMKIFLKNRVMDQKQEFESFDSAKNVIEVNFSSDEEDKSEKLSEKNDQKSPRVNRVSQRGISPKPSSHSNSSFVYIKQSSINPSQKSKEIVDSYDLDS